MRYIGLFQAALIFALPSLLVILAQGCDWTGTWNTNYGTMDLQQYGNSVTGTYTYSEGHIKGTANGNQLVGSWTENSGTSGTFDFAIATDCNSFDGNWRTTTSGSWSGHWTGTRTSATSSPGSASSGTGTPTFSIEDLTGVWSCNDGGKYYIRQLGNAIWWYGEASTNPVKWSNVAKGTISGSTINLEWADVPKGIAAGNSGILVLNMVLGGCISPVAGAHGGTMCQVNALTTQSQTGGFGGSWWSKLI